MKPVYFQFSPMKIFTHLSLLTLRRLGLVLIYAFPFENAYLSSTLKQSITLMKAEAFKSGAF